MMSLKVFFCSLSFTMVVLVIWTSLQSNMFELPPAVVNEPWFRTTLVDFYFNIAILSAWIIYKERSVMARVGWILSFVLLGSIATAFYVFLQFLRLKKDEGIEKVLLRAS
jgi:hypothetical protein